jgi:hypothetical protein
LSSAIELLFDSETPKHRQTRVRHLLVWMISPVGCVPGSLKVKVTHLPGQDSGPPQRVQGRFQLVLRRLISVFARPAHPLALFIDDLQWLDAATLDLIEDLFDRGLARRASNREPVKEKALDQVH